MMNNDYKNLLECKKRYDITDQEYLVLTVILTFNIFGTHLISEKTDLDESLVEDILESSTNKLLFTDPMEFITIDELRNRIELLATNKTLKEKILSGLLSDTVELRFIHNKITIMDGKTGIAWNKNDLSDLIAYLKEEDVDVDESETELEIVRPYDSKKAGEFILIQDQHLGVYAFRFTRKLNHVANRINELNQNKENSLKVITHFWCEDIRRFLSFVKFYYEGKLTENWHENWYHLNDSDIEFITSNHFYSYIKKEYEKMQDEKEKFITPGGHLLWFKKRDGTCKMINTHKNDWRYLKDRARHEDSKYEPIVLYKTRELESLVSYFHRMLKGKRVERGEIYLLSDDEIVALKKCPFRDELDITKVVTTFTKNRFNNY